MIDAVLLTEDEVSILFSFTRSHFNVDVVRPYDLVRFLGRLMPRKRIAELYISIGQNKHGKTELYRDLLRHLNSTDERFEHVPGTSGPGDDRVRHAGLRRRLQGDPRQASRLRNARLGPPSWKSTGSSPNTTAQGGSSTPRTSSTSQFHRARFDPSFSKSSITDAGRTVRSRDDTVVISHLYVERRVIPLDLYAREAALPAATAAVIDYGQAIKDLACTNIFPGDLLTKNFGVTRHGRVVFYDYDELSALTDVVFREMPAPRDDDEALAETPWFSVGAHERLPRGAPAVPRPAR